MKNVKFRGKNDEFRVKNSAAQIPRPKFRGFRGPRKTVGPTDDMRRRRRHPKGRLREKLGNCHVDYSAFAM